MAVPEKGRGRRDALYDCRQEKRELKAEVQRLRKRLDWIAHDRHPEMSPQEAAKDALKEQ